MISDNSRLLVIINKTSDIITMFTLYILSLYACRRVSCVTVEDDQRKQVMKVI